MPDGSFSQRFGLRGDQPLIYENAPESLRMGLREVVHTLGWNTPSLQRDILCKALRVAPDPNDWSEYPNIDQEVAGLIWTGPCYRFYDAIERLPRFLPEDKVDDYRGAMNTVFRDERIGYRFESGSLVRVGTDEFHAALGVARSVLTDQKVRRGGPSIRALNPIPKRHVPRLGERDQGGCQLG